MCNKAFMLVQPSLAPDIIIFLNKYWPLVKTKKPVTTMMMLRKSVLKDISRKLFYQENCERGERGKVVNLVSVFFHQRDCIGGFAQITTLTFCCKKTAMKCSSWQMHRLCCNMLMVFSKSAAPQISQTIKCPAEKQRLLVASSDKVLTYFWC